MARSCAAWYPSSSDLLLLLAGFCCAGCVASTGRTSPSSQLTEGGKASAERRQESGTPRESTSGGQSDLGQTDHRPGASSADERSEHASAEAHDHHRHDFSDVEDYVSRFEGAERDAWQKPADVVRLLGLAPGQTVVDLGTGTGYFLPYIVRALGESGKVIALDSEPNMVDYVNQRAQREGLTGVEARSVAPHDPELPRGAVHRILIVNTWHHLPSRTRYSRLLADALEHRSACQCPESPRKIAPSGVRAFFGATFGLICSQLGALGI